MILLHDGHEGRSYNFPYDTAVKHHDGIVGPPMGSARPVDRSG